MASFQPPFDPIIHLHSPSPNEEQVNLIEQMRSSLIKDEPILSSHHAAWLTDQQLWRFLLARTCHLEAAYDLIITALKWREKRRPADIESIDGWEEKMKRESETGKIYCPGHDKYHRPLLVFDNTVQNTHSVDDQMTFLAWNLESAIQLMPADQSVDKYVVFMHLTDFSILNAPGFSATTETISMLCSCYPERLGHCIAYQPPTYFRIFFDTVKMFLDPKTVSKMVFIHGDVSDGSPNDNKLKEIIGDDWKVLTGAEQARMGPRCSPGYNHDKQWTLVRERRILKAVDDKSITDTFNRQLEDNITDQEEESTKSITIIR